MNTYQELRSESFDRDDCVEIMTEMKDQSDFEACDYRFIHTDDIDDVMKDELLSDLYVLGCCTPWFISEITDLDVDEIEKAQKNESFELLGALMAKQIDEVQSKMAGFHAFRVN